MLPETACRKSFLDGGEAELKVIVDKWVRKISIYPHPLIHFNDLIESG